MFLTDQSALLDFIGATCANRVVLDDDPPVEYFANPDNSLCASK